MNKKLRNRESIVLSINCIQVLIYTFAFYVLWLINYHDLVYFYRKGNWLIAFIYSVLFILFSYLYDGFKIGSKKTTDLMFSQSIATIFSSICIYIIACLINKTFVVLTGTLIIALCLVLLNIFVCAISLYFIKALLPALKSIYLYEESEDALSKLVKYQSGLFNFVDKKRIISFYNDLNFADYDCVFININDKQLKSDLIKKCYSIGKSIYVVPSYDDVILKCSEELNLVDVPLLKSNSFGPSQFEKIIKRLMDILISFILLVLTSPLILMAAIAIKLEDKGPVIYKQRRLTQYGRTFDIFKFRSMRVDAEKNGAQFAKANDDRITKVGKIIRATRIDELPQLCNILIGDMSIVGPRPERPEIHNDTIKNLPEFDYRLKVKAGLTGFAQIYGKYNTKLKDKLLFDLLYIENYSLFLDIRILFMTFKIVFSKESTEGYE